MSVKEEEEQEEKKDNSAAAPLSLMSSISDDNSAAAPLSLMPPISLIYPWMDQQQWQPMMAPYAYASPSIHGSVHPHQQQQWQPMMAPYAYAPPSLIHGFVHPHQQQQWQPMMAPYLHNQTPLSLMHGPVYSWMVQQQQQSQPMMVPYASPSLIHGYVHPGQQQQCQPMMTPDLHNYPWMDQQWQPMMAPYLHNQAPPPDWDQQPPQVTQQNQAPPPAWIQQPLQVTHQPQQYSASQPQPTTTAEEEEEDEDEDEEDENEDEDDDDDDDDGDDDSAASDIVTTDKMLQQEETFTTYGQGYATPTKGVPVRYMYVDNALLYPQGKQGLDSNWEDTKKYWRSLPQTSLVPVVRLIFTKKMTGYPKDFRDLAEKKENVDVTKRVSEIATFLEQPFYLLLQVGITITKFEDVLDELQGYARSFDVVRQLHSIGGLDKLLLKLLHTHPRICAKAAEVITTLLQYNSRSLQLLMESDCRSDLIHNSYAKFDETSRINALGAIFALIWYNIPAITGFEWVDWKDLYSCLSYILGSESESVGFQRQVLNLIHHLLLNGKYTSECNIVTWIALHLILSHPASSDDAELREAAIMCLYVLLPRVEENCVSLYLAFSDDAEFRVAALEYLLVLARDEGGGNISELVKNDYRLKLVLKELLFTKDLGATTWEHVYSLWNVCYNF